MFCLVEWQLVDSYQVVVFLLVHSPRCTSVFDRTLWIITLQMKDRHVIIMEPTIVRKSCDFKGSENMESEGANVCIIRIIFLYCVLLP